MNTENLARAMQIGIKFLKLERPDWNWEKCKRYALDAGREQIQREIEKEARRQLGEQREARRVREQDRRLINPTEEVFMLAKEYEKEGESRVSLFSRLFRDNPITRAAYDRQVKNKGRRSLTEKSFAVDARVKAYMKESSEKNYKTALRHVMADGARSYQDETEGGVEILNVPPDVKPQDMRPGSPHQKLGALMSDAVANGDIQGALRAGNAYPFLVEQAFMEVMIRLGKVEAQSLGIPGPSSEAERVGRSIAARRYPDVNRAIATGVMNEAALRVGYPSWFKD